MSGRRLIAATFAVLIVSGLGRTDAAQAATGYKFWNYFHGHNGGWQFARTGAASYIPVDGSVEGWRYGISDGVHGRQPRTNPDFDAICAGNPSEDANKRVAVVIDFGVREEAPEGQEPSQPIGACAVVPTGFNGQQVLEAVAQVRTDAMVCGINGYPATGCAVPTGSANIQREPPVQLRIVPADAGSSASRSGLSGELIALAVLIVTIGIAGVMLMRRRA